MDVREKLVELIEQSGACFECFPVGDYEQKQIEKIANHLIAHGVTILDCKRDCANCWKTKMVTPMWISVKERLPKDGEIVTICTDKGFVYAGELIGDTWFLDLDSWTANVTHWMPLPQPPKGE